jgi:hypothetical protein
MIRWNAADIGSGTGMEIESIFSVLTPSPQIQQALLFGYQSGLRQIELMTVRPV